MSRAPKKNKTKTYIYVYIYKKHMLFFNNEKGRTIAIFFWVFLLILKVGCVYWEGVGGRGIYAYVVFFQK